MRKQKQKKREKRKQSSPKAELARKSHLLQVLHLVNHEGVIREEYIAPDDLEVWKKFAEALQTVDAIQKKVAGDLSQIREGDILEIRLGIILDQHDLKEAFDHMAVLQYREEVDVIPDVYALTNAIRDG